MNNYKELITCNRNITNKISDTIFFSAKERQKRQLTPLKYNALCATETFLQFKHGSSVKAKKYFGAILRGAKVQNLNF